MEESRKQDESEFNLREWALKAKLNREKTNSRRYSASYIRSFREEAKSFRSNVTISSTASSPGYALREEIDPSKYSFTTALKGAQPLEQAKPSMSIEMNGNLQVYKFLCLFLRAALQAKTIYSWEYMSPDGLALNSKWNEAEKYICNPLSGEVPLECLSTKILSGRSFRQPGNRIAISGPLIYPSQIQNTPQFQTKHHVEPSLPTNEVEVQIPSKEKKEVTVTRDKGTQSISAYVSSNSPSPAPTPSIEEMSIKLSSEAADSSSPMTPSSIKEISTKHWEADHAAGHSPVTSPKLTSEQEVEVKETGEEEDTKRKEQVQQLRGQRNEKVKKRCRQIGGCLSWKSLWMRRTRHREKHKSTNNNIFLCHINGCYKH
ncbi:putative allene oxide cyclase 3, chloroplastic [Capsicum annuum]|nr:putative allene oxide cyclase 3, chloroplastic [Capsicum annuum]